MKIYVSHSTSFDFNQELYTPIRNSELNNKHEIILPHEESDKQYNTLELFKSGECELVIAEVSYPSTGQGIELGWARLLEIPIIAIHKNDHKFSGAIHLLTKEIHTYGEINSLLTSLKL